jgi:hypothetical protein
MWIIQLLREIPVTQKKILGRNERRNDRAFLWFTYWKWNTHKNNAKYLIFCMERLLLI